MMSESCPLHVVSRRPSDRRASTSTFARLAPWKRAVGGQASQGPPSLYRDALVEVHQHCQMLALLHLEVAIEPRYDVVGPACPLLPFVRRCLTRPTGVCLLAVGSLWSRRPASLILSGVFSSLLFGAFHSCIYPSGSIHPLTLALVLEDNWYGGGIRPFSPICRSLEALFR